jgi:hypothetical protein
MNQIIGGFILKNPRMYSFLALIIAISMAVTLGCSKVSAPNVAPAVPATPTAPAVTPTPMAAPVTGASDLVINKVWLDGLTIYYTIKNVGTADSPQTYSYIFVDDLMPSQGGTSFVDVLKPGQEKLLSFNNYEWPFGKEFGVTQAQVKPDSAGYIELRLDNHKVRVCADGKSAAGEATETNNCKVTLIGMMWDYDLLRVSNLATWRNGDGNLPEPGGENNAHGAHFQIPNRDMAVTPQLETIPQQVPQGWIQGIWGYFYSDDADYSPKMAAIKIPAKLHFVARVGLSRDATGTDGVTFRFGLRDLNDTVTWIDSKKVTSPGAFENWDINLSNYEGQKYYFFLRVDAGASPVNDFAIWNQARLIQVND